MSARQRYALAVAVAICLESRATAEPYEPKPGETLHLKTPSTAKTDGGTDLRLPPGYFLDEKTHGALDVEMKRLQDVETRLNAENKSMRARLASWQPGLYVLGTALVVGFSAGFYIGRK